MDMQAVYSEVNTRPVEDRLRLIDSIWDGLIEQGHEPSIDDEMKAELDRRCDELDRNPDDVVPWETVEARHRDPSLWKART
ncbi:MAG TPA: addiction module protein [Pirellulales bacterium]|nr:addiction module protein [Pirellulales bacterium]